MQESDCKTGIYFYEKCLEISRLTGELGGEMAANHNLGLAHQSLNDIPNAITFHERHLNLAKSSSDVNETAAANIQLIKVLYFPQMIPSVFF